MTADPERGGTMPEIDLRSGDGRTVRPSDYRHRRNIVAVFLDGAAGDALSAVLSPLGRRYPEFFEEETEILAVVAGPPARAEEVRRRGELPFPVLADEDGRAHRDTGTLPRGGEPPMSLFIVDRYGQIFASFRAAAGRPLPGPEEILEWIRYIDRQCPE